MQIDYKHLKKEFFDPYVRYWIAFAVFILLYLIRVYRIEYLETDGITMNIKNARYVGNGIVLNKHQVLVNKTLVESACWDRLHYQQGNFYAIDDIYMYPLFQEMSDNLTDSIVLSIKTADFSFSNYAIFDMDSEVSYKVNRRMILPIQINRVSTYSFKTTRLTTLDELDYLLASRNVPKDDFALGMPVFNSNYVIQGTIRQRNNSIRVNNFRDKILDMFGVQKLFETNKIELVKRFLDREKVEYYVGDADVSTLTDDRFNIKKSIISIICLQGKR